MYLGKLEPIKLIDNCVTPRRFLGKKITRIECLPVCVYGCMCTTCIQCPQKPEKVIRSLGTRVTLVSHNSHVSVGFELNPDFLQEKQVPPTSPRPSEHESVVEGAPWIVEG